MKQLFTKGKHANPKIVLYVVILTKIVFVFKEDIRKVLTACESGRHLF